MNGRRPLCKKWLIFRKVLEFLPRISLIQGFLSFVFLVLEVMKLLWMDATLLNQNSGTENGAIFS